ncbi:MAG: PQQ-binding-like beta-propeller repeat protein, partial [Planctomycetes bacterium]|nr:PQQ-binding-like beta-propeller repeat protein [Planctomycetota bacterium]
EIKRVLVPNGVAYIKTNGEWTKILKPRPDNIDDWTHFLHDASGNAVAKDEVVGPPRHLQWLGSPRWSRHHDRMASMSAMVSANGRIFYIMDEGSRVSIQLPSNWMLVARDAFNGTVLWKKPISKWHSHLWPLKSGPTQLARRLVAVGDKVFVTLAIDGPLTMLDAATGETLRTYKETAATEELILDNGKLFLLVNKGASRLSDFAPVHNLGDQRRIREEFHWNKKPRQVMAVNADTGETLWKHESIVAPLTLASKDDRVFYHDGERLVCRNGTSGEQLWATEPIARRASITFNFGPKLVIYKNVALFAGGDRTMRALAVDSGKELWSAPHARGGYQSPEDLLVAGGLVWCAPTTSGKDSGIFTGRDPQTGEVKSEFPPDVETYWFHHRCYIAKATDRFLLASRTGIEFVDPATKHWDINHWVRGGCLYGVMPCNGLVYAPPHNCACYPEAKLYGMNVLAPKMATRAVPRDVPDEGRLERGESHAFVPPEGDPAIGDWPTFRHDKGRSGVTDVSVPAELEESWSAKIGGKLSAPTVAAGRVYVAQIDTHTVHALDAKSGDSLWSYTTGGRVDSPPTFDRGRVLFGSADGWVYCLQAEDGKLIWRFRGAPRDERLTAFEQLESVWPIHGSVLVENDVAFFVAGRSNFLDGGMRFIRLNAITGEKLTETILDHTDPTSGKDLQDRIKVLNMPVALPDILSSDGKYVYMRSQAFDPVEGKRVELGPHSSQPAEQGSVQKGETAHLFAPMGYLDSTYFHRAYWVYGRSFAGGHAGYYQAGKYAPSGRILVADDKNVFGFGRKPQYYKWTTIIEHQLFSTSKQPP